MYPRYPNKRGQCGLPKWPNCCIAILEHKPHKNRGKRTSVGNVLMKKGGFTPTVTWLRNLKIFKCEETLINVARKATQEEHGSVFKSKSEMRYGYTLTGCKGKKKHLAFSFRPVFNNNKGEYIFLRGKKAQYWNLHWTIVTYA